MQGIQKYPQEGSTLKVRNKFWETAPIRDVKVETINGFVGIRCKEEWFHWDYFFEVNVIA